MSVDGLFNEKFASKFFRRLCVCIDYHVNVSKVKAVALFNEPA